MLQLPSEPADHGEAGLAGGDARNDAHALGGLGRRADEPQHRRGHDRGTTDAEQDLARHQVASRAGVEVEAACVAARGIGADRVGLVLEVARLQADDDAAGQRDHADRRRGRRGVAKRRERAVLDDRRIAGLVVAGLRRRGGLRRIDLRDRLRHVGELLEPRDLDARTLRLAGDLDPRRPRLVPRRLAADLVRAGIDRHALIPQRGIDELIAALDHEAVDLARVGDADREVRQVRLERVRPLARLALARRIARAARRRRGLEERRPRGRELVVLLAAVGEVEQRADAAIEVLGCRELVARLGALALFHQALALAEQRLGAGGVACSGCAGGAGGATGFTGSGAGFGGSGGGAGSGAGTAACTGGASGWTSPRPLSRSSANAATPSAIVTPPSANHTTLPRVRWTGDVTPAAPLIVVGGGGRCIVGFPVSAIVSAPAPVIRASCASHARWRSSIDANRSSGFFARQPATSSSTARGRPVANVLGAGAGTRRCAEMISPTPS